MFLPIGLSFSHTLILTSWKPGFLSPRSLKSEPNQLVCRNYRAINNEGQSAAEESSRGGNQSYTGPLLSACAARDAGASELLQHNNTAFYELHCMIFTGRLNLLGAFHLMTETGDRICVLDLLLYFNKKGVEWHFSLFKVIPKSFFIVLFCICVIRAKRGKLLGNRRCHMGVLG